MFTSTTLKNHIGLPVEDKTIKAFPIPPGGCWKLWAEVEDCGALLTIRTGLTMGLARSREYGRMGSNRSTPRNPRLSSPVLESFRGFREHRMEAKRQLCAFMSSMLILLSVPVPAPQLQPLSAPQAPGSSQLYSYIRLLSEAHRASSLLCCKGPTFPTLPRNGSASGCCQLDLS